MILGVSFAYVPSMQAIAARRGGLFELQAENGVFLLRLALPLNG